MINLQKIKAIFVIALFTVNIFAVLNNNPANADDTFDPMDVPVVTTNAATNITTNNATLNGYLNNDGNETCTVGFNITAGNVTN